MSFAAVHESPLGTFGTRVRTPSMSAAEAGTDIHLALIRKETRGLNPAGSSLYFVERTFSVALFGKLSFNGERACS